MKVKTLAILLIVLAVLTGVVFAVLMQHSSQEGKRELGTPLLKNLPANDIASVTILGGGGNAVQLSQTGNRWVVKDRFGYPADFSKLVEFVRKLKDAKIGRSFAASEKALKRLHLKDPGDKEGEKEEKGTAITLADANGKPLVHLIMGQPMKGGKGGFFPEGQYVILGNRKTVYLIDKQFEGLGETPAEWLKKDLIDVKGEDIGEIVCLDPDGKTTRFAFRRPEKGKDLEPVGLPPGKKIKRSSVNRLAGALSGLQIEDVVDPAKAGEIIGMANSAKIEYHLFNGMIYDLYPGSKCKEGEPCYLKVAVRYQIPGPVKTAAKEVPKTEGDKEKAGDAERTMEQKAEALNKELGRWTYTIPRWKHDALATDLASLLDKEKKKEK
jgi:hypothetical protein